MLANYILEILDGFLRLVFHKVPLVNHDHQRLLVLLYQLEDIHILGLNATGGIEHQDADIRILNGTDTAHHGIELQVLTDFILSTDTGGIYQIEIKAEFIVAGIDTVTGGTGYLGHDMTFLTDKGVDDTAFSRIGTAHHGKAGNTIFKQISALLGQFFQNKVEQIARSRTSSSTDT